MVLFNTTTHISDRFYALSGGKLIFDDVDVELHAKMILVTNGGVLQVGTEASPYLHNALIQMHGHPRQQELPIYGTKTLAVREGTLDLHGQFTVL